MPRPSNAVVTAGLISKSAAYAAFGAEVLAAVQASGLLVPPRKKRSAKPKRKKRAAAVASPPKKRGRPPKATPLAAASGLTVEEVA